MKRIFILFLLFSFHLTTFTYAATAPNSGGGWPNKTITRVGLDDVIEATARQQAIRNGSSVTLEAVVRETVNRQAVGKVLLSRLLAGGLLIGATQSLIEGIGWVMEDGVYVKYKDKNPELNSQFIYRVDTTNYSYVSYQDAAANYFKQKLNKQDPRTYSALKSISVDGQCDFFWGGAHWCNLKVYYYTERGNIDINPDADPDAPPSSFPLQVNKVPNPDYEPDPSDNKERIVLTDKMVGDMAVGDYTDPVDSKNDKKDRKWTGVEQAYEHDPSGTGNELSNALDYKMDNAPETPTKPNTPPQTDGQGQKHPTDKDKGTEGKTDQEKDPTTGQPTGSGTFNLPEWCLWAADQCQWHKEDKKHQEDETKVWEDEKKHRGDEKTFWQKVIDFFDWVKEEPEKDNEQEQPDIDDKGIFSKTFDYVFSLSKQCPPDIPINLETKFFSGSFVFSLKWLCMIFTFLGYPLVFASHCTGVWILYEAVIRKEFRW
ncbi:MULTISPECIES: hypothetical protein [Acinetobacter]|uniref:hypothetical protein n=1 Tax=Acinetobacter TaxID=469 RepID=UPI001F4A8118|nr:MULTISPECIES: hypothetical protein [Acinetobacter]MCH7378601.1 hypothetical protein [Acinetobacter higginsii]